MSRPAPRISDANDHRLTAAAATLGYEIVDIAGFLDLVEEHAFAQSEGLQILKQRAIDVAGSNSDVQQAVMSLVEHTGTTVQDVAESAAAVRRSGENTRAVAAWVQDVSQRTNDIGDTLSAVKSNNQQIASIATQVNTLAINAKIEAARAGDAGRGFAVVAEAIDELSRKTREAAQEITDNIEALTAWIATLGDEADTIANRAAKVLKETGNTDEALTRMESSTCSADTQAQRISDQANRVATAVADFEPALSRIDGAISGTTSGIKETHERVLRLIDTSESIVQMTALLSETSPDAPFIQAVRDLADQISHQMEAALADGSMTLSRLFDRTYRPIPGKDPEQYMTEFTRFMDKIMPPLQEPALALDPKVVFCAAVDNNGYLPTHNLKFSQEQSDDPVWNTAHCRNRRLFDDRVGLKAGRNTNPFLLQVYRRDMGGGAFKMMKDLSAPIRVKGRHWGGLRLAYSFD